MSSHGPLSPSCVRHILHELCKHTHTLPSPASCMCMYTFLCVHVCACANPSTLNPKPLRVQERGKDPILPFSGTLEAKLADMPEDEAAKYLKENEVTR